MGYPPPFPAPHPDVEATMQRILRVVHEDGKKCGIVCASGEQAAKRAAEGFDMISTVSDVMALQTSIVQNLAAAVAGN